jgi:DNA-binding response OmpR family regulator
LRACAQGELLPRPPEQVSILVVEDDPAIRRLVTMVLERQKYRMDTASDGVEAILKLGIVDYDLIILDLMMPNLDGFALIEGLAQNTPERLATIIVTSAASPAVIRDRLKGIPLDVLPKPFDINMLIERVGSKLGQIDAAREAEKAKS